MNEDQSGKKLPAAEAQAPSDAKGSEEGAEGAHPVRVRFHESENGLKCIFRGRLDTPTSLALEPELKARFANAQGKRIVYDLAAADYVASSFLRLCIYAAKLTGGNFALLNPNPDVRRALRIAGMESLVKAD
jgi:anti-anti-sigma factor